MTSQPTEAVFLRDVAEHVMTVIRDDGVHRHLRFRQPHSWCYGFNIITWPGALCIDGDMGTYVFRRLDDMFEFFRDDHRHGILGPSLHINKGYWAEKCVSDATFKGLQEFDKEKFCAAVVDEYRNWLDDNWDRYDAAKRREVRRALRDDVLACVDDGEHEAMRAAMGFHVDGVHFEMQDFYEHSVRSYTFHFVWCLYAIAYAVAEYDRQRTTAKAA